MMRVEGRLGRKKAEDGLDNVRERERETERERARQVRQGQAKLRRRPVPPPPAPFHLRACTSADAMQTKCRDIPHSGKPIIMRL
jgi:hypothetical protein